MKKAKQIAAIISIILLVGMYVLTLVFALFDRSETLALLKASLYSTVTIPVMLYVFILVTKLIKNKSKEDLEKFYSASGSDDSEPDSDISK